MLNNSVSKSEQPSQLNESKHDFFIIQRPEYTSPLTFWSFIIPRLFTFKSEHEIKVGDSLYCASSKTAKARGNRYKGSGIVVNSVKFNSVFYCLATLDIDLLSSEITLNNEHGPQLNLIKKWINY